MRWLRFARRHGRGVTATVCGIGSALFWLSRGQLDGAIVGGPLAAALVYGMLWVVDGLYAAGVLRGGR